MAAQDTAADVDTPEASDPIHRDLQVTLVFEDGTEQTFTVIRDRGMRWRGSGTSAPLVAIDAEWFDNPPTIRSE